MPAQADISPPLLLVAHRAPDTAALLRSLLEREGYAAICAYNGRVARQLIQQSRPVLALLDQALPLIDGLELCRALRRESDTPAIFILSDRPDELNKLLAFSAGADDYLTLPMDPRELLGRVRVALRRIASRSSAAQPIIRRGRIELDPEQRRVRAAGQEAALTALEFELLAVFVRHPGRVFSREELLNRLSGFLRGAPLDRAVDIHVSNLRHKLRQAMGDNVPIETVRGAGYRLRIEPADEAANEADERGGDASLGRLALAALDRAPMPLLALSLDRTVLLYNQAAQRLCGWKADEVAGQVKCYSLLGCHNADGTMLCHDACPMRSALLNGVNDHQARYVITLKDGRETPVTARYTRFSVAGAQSDCVLLVLQPESESAAGMS
ncbi:MAG TPA: winged helix-turn-helix domain-containing protein [Ktedonobacterales bacterium]|nr:winged helix-turn-helix domain-containing protein [Ktedonobacterales bacterium]